MTKQSEYSSDFESLWKIYPRRFGDDPKKLAWKAYRARLREGIKPEALFASALNYAKFVQQQHTNGTEYVMMCASFLGPNERWRGYETQPEVKTAAAAPKAREEALPSRPVSREEGQAFVREIMETLVRAKTSPTCGYEDRQVSRQRAK
jgi:hypothetical protein